ncbi:MAG TPA: TolC family protein [Ignavibacteriaceae bacterium]|nr:TolC family protein [Ignavibacteriaceae bacterium]
MIKKVLFAAVCLGNLLYAQYNLDYFVNKALQNSPVLKDYQNLSRINDLQSNLDEAENSAFKVSLTANYLFAPYFNNNGKYISTNPDPKAIGYDVGITNGGLYSAQLNFDKNIFNGDLLDVLQKRKLTLNKSYENKSEEEKHALKKEVTDIYLKALQDLLLYNLSQKTVENLNDQLKITGDLVKNGYVKAQDYLLLKVELNSQKINLDETWQSYESGLSQLYSICGIRDTQIVKIDSVELVQKEDEAIHSNFLTKFYLDSLNTTNQQQIFETKYQPQVGLFFNAGLNAVEIENIQRKLGFSAGINFSLPILDGGQKDITRQQTEIAKSTLKEYKNYLSNNISTQLNNSESKIKSINKNLCSMEEQVDDYGNILMLSRKQLKQGNLSMIEYLTLLRNYFEYQKKIINTRINYQLEINNYNYWNW